MFSRTLAVIAFAVLSIALTLSDTRFAYAQVKGPGTVSWAANYPKGGPGPGGTGVIEVQGTYTVNQGWTLINPGVYYTPKAGGVVSGVAVDTQNGDWGELKGGAIGVKSIAVAAGDYWVYSDFVYQDVAGNKVNVQSSHVLVSAK